jgi:hypothetical protein
MAAIRELSVHWIAASKNMHLPSTAPSPSSFIGHQAKSYGAVAKMPLSSISSHKRSRQPLKGTVSGALAQKFSVVGLTGAFLIIGSISPRPPASLLNDAQSISGLLFVSFLVAKLTQHPATN